MVGAGPAGGAGGAASWRCLRTGPWSSAKLPVLGSAAALSRRVCSSAHAGGCAGRRGAEGGGGDDARPPRAAG